MEKEKLNTTDNTSIDDDKLLQEFFADSVSMCIADNGFSKRVMNQLPQTTVAKAKQMPKRQQIAYILWTVVCCVLVIVHTVMTDGLNVLANCLQKVAATTTLTVSFRNDTGFFTAINVTTFGYATDHCYHHCGGWSHLALRYDM